MIESDAHRSNSGEGHAELVFESPMLGPELVHVQPGADARWVVLGRSPTRVGVLSPDGLDVRWSAEGLLTTQVTVATFLDDEQLLVVDRGRASIEIFDIDTLHRVRSLALEGGTESAMSWKCDPRGRACCLVTDGDPRPWRPGAVPDGPDTFTVRALEALRWTDVAHVPAPTLPGMIYGPRFTWCVSGNGEAVVADGRDGRVSHLVGDECVLTAPAPTPGAPLSDDERGTLRAIVASEGARLADDISPLIAKLFASEPVGDRYPAFMQMLADDADRIWFRLPAHVAELADLEPRVSFHAVDSGSHRWMVQARGGTARWRVTFRPGFQPTALRGDLVAGVLHTQEGGVVQGYRVTFGRDGRA